MFPSEQVSLRGFENHWVIFVLPRICWPTFLTSNFPQFVSARARRRSAPPYRHPRYSLSPRRPPSAIALSLSPLSSLSSRLISILPVSQHIQPPLLPHSPCPQINAAPVTNSRSLPGRIPFFLSSHKAFDLLHFTNRGFYLSTYCLPSPVWLSASPSLSFSSFLFLCIYVVAKKKKKRRPVVTPR